ncbi:MAG TPA: hypothetical protein VFB49_00765 [Patescibacteria group bacterium]|nr:hypothetical protein [Patescibacteria group bacterium]
MTRTRLAAALAALGVVVCVAGTPLLAQEEPELIPKEQVAPPEKPALDSTPPATATGPLRAALDFKRWQEMTARERQTFVEGAIQALSSVTLRLRADMETDGKVPPESLAAMVRFMHEHYPRFPATMYLREMDSIYMRSDGQNLSMSECFDQAFRRINAR